MMADLPTGTVTFLFTDIEGSTHLLQRLGSRYGDVLAEYRRLLRSALEAAGGHEVDTQGDSFFVVFPQAVEGVKAAVAAQQASAADGLSLSEPRSTWAFASFHEDCHDLLRRRSSQVG